MQTIRHHMFQRRRSTGELRLVIDVISRDAPDMLCFWVSKTLPRGLLVRAESFDLYEITGISPEVIDDVRKAKSLRVIEWDEDGAIIRDCDVPSVAGDEPRWWQRAGRWCQMKGGEISVLGSFLSAALFDRGESE